jgi:hypothetical protein
MLGEDPLNIFFHILTHYSIPKDSTNQVLQKVDIWSSVVLQPFFFKFILSLEVVLIFFGIFSFSIAL